MKYKHHQVVDLNNPNEGQFTSASTSAKTFNNKMSKQTAVEWLVNELEEHHVFHDIKNTVAFQQANKMFEKQIEKAFADGVDDEYEWHINNQPRTNAEQYYTQTFNQ